MAAFTSGADQRPRVHRQRTAVVVNHVGYDDPGFVGIALSRVGLVWQMVYREDFNEPPDLGGTSLLVLLGSLWSPIDDTNHPEIQHELSLIRSALESGTPVLGVCFGAQLLARVVGTHVYNLSKPVIGYHPVTIGPDTGMQFFWNHYGFDAPPESDVIAVGGGSCAAFRLQQAIGVQFHIDATPTLLERWTFEGLGELQRYNVSREEVLEMSDVHAGAVLATCYELVQAVTG